MDSGLAGGLAGSPLVPAGGCHPGPCRAGADTGTVVQPGASVGRSVMVGGPEMDPDGDVALLLEEATEARDAIDAAVTTIGMIMRRLANLARSAPPPPLPD